ncbi:MAG: hypothetical protein KGH56_03065 [Patescibacteria group bacterium]|nr:hypothetical protein [Patescibacteria group bacterium]
MEYSFARGRVDISAIILNAQHTMAKKRKAAKKAVKKTKKRKASKKRR